MKKKKLSQRKPYRTGRQNLDRLIDEITELSSFGTERRYLQEMFVTLVRLFEEPELNSGDHRLVNITLKELWYSLKVFSPYRHVRKVALFGSARLGKRTKAYQQAKRFSKSIAARGWMVITGASSGIMSAGNEGAGRANSFGVNIRLPFETDANPAIKGDGKLINYKYFFTRKLTFIRESDATVLAPGGFGTHDEGFETLTLVQTGKANPRPIVCLDPKGSTYWDRWKDYIEKELAGNRMIDDDDLDLVFFTHDEDEAVRYVDEFYSNYHSMRFVKDLLVIRMKTLLSPAALRRINREFRDLVESGRIRQQESHFPEEEQEPYTFDLKRLYFRFNRRHHVRLIHLVHALNQAV